MESIDKVYDLCKNELLHAYLYSSLAEMPASIPFHLFSTYNNLLKCKTLPDTWDEHHLMEDWTDKWSIAGCEVIIDLDRHAKTITWRIRRMADTRPTASTQAQSPGEWETATLPMLPAPIFLVYSTGSSTSGVEILKN